MSTPDPGTTDWVPLAQPAAAGAELTYEGDYSGATTYQDGDVVVKDGIAYLCVGGPTTTAPDPVPWGAAMLVASVPTGALTQFAGAAAPTGWLLCDGASLLRADYAALFTVIGTAYGTVDGTHFSIPDMRARMPFGKGTGGDTANLGISDGLAVGNRTYKHRHTVNDPGHAHSINEGWDGATTIAQTRSSNHQAYFNTNAATTGITVGPAGSPPLDSPAFLIVNFIIKT